MQNGRYRRWCFTLFLRPVLQADGRLPEVSGSDQDTSSEEGGARIQEVEPSTEEGWLRVIETLWQDLYGLGCQFMCLQVERCPSTRRLHLQGYTRFASGVRMRQIKALYRRMRLQRCNGSEASNIEYCTKDPTRVFGPYMYGERGVQGKRSDIAIVRGMIDDGKGMRDVVDAVNSYQAIRCGELLLKYKERRRNWKPFVQWFHGSTGTGKTQTACEMYPDAWMSARNLKWWDGYDAHADVIIDDFRADFCTFHELLRILDRYSYRIEHKGGSRQLLARNIVVTCPYSPTEMFKHRCGEDINQLLRRIDVIRLFGDQIVVRNDGAVSSHFVSRD